MINVDDLLKPVADDKPSGEDFTYHPSFQELETLSRGKPETQFGPGEDPDWKEVRDAAMELLGQSKLLPAAIILTTSLLKIGGVEGLRDGFAVVHGLTEKFWADLYPKLDPDDNNDPTERLNILHELSGTKFGGNLRQLVLCNSPSMGQITLDQYLIAKDRASKGPEAQGDAPSPDLAQIQAAFQDAGPDAINATLGLVNETIEHCQGIDKFLDSTLGAGNGVNFENLDKLLDEMKSALESYAGNGAPAEAAVADEAASASGGGSGGARSAVKAGAGISGGIQSRADVVKALDLISRYYVQNEPSSPVPLIIDRAKRLVD